MVIAWKVQVSKYPTPKSGYKHKGTYPNLNMAWLWYSGINIGNGYKKRLIEFITYDDGSTYSRILNRRISHA